MIAIDNAVELTIRTYLGLPKRITGLHLSRKEFGEISETFPALLDALERYASDRLAGVDLGEIEWYHRLRNELYHQGNGLTVERDKVDVYAQLANVLFRNLFGIELVRPTTTEDRRLGDFLDAWIELERCLVRRAQPSGAAREMNPFLAARYLRRSGCLTLDEMKQFEHLREFRNKIVHGMIEHRDSLTPEIIAQVRALGERLAERA